MRLNVVVIWIQRLTVYRAVGGLHSAVGLSLWQARRSGTHYQSIPTEFRSLSVSFGDFSRSVKTYDTVRAIFAHSAQ